MLIYDMRLYALHLDLALLIKKHWNFESGLKLLTESGELPSSYGVTLDELDGDAFDEEEEIIISKNKNSFPIMLPSQIWKP